jgi:hypothetical protein
MHATKLTSACMQGQSPVIIIAPDEVRRSHVAIRRVVEGGQEKFVMPQGPTLAHFFSSNGPPSIVLHNWNKVRGPSRKDHLMYINIDHVVRAKPGAKQLVHDAADMVTLSEVGIVQLTKNPKTVVYKMELSCIGRAAKSYEGEYRSNCEPVEGNSGRHGQCKARVLVTRTAQDVQEGNVVVQLSQNHVSEGLQTRHVPLVGLRPDSELLRKSAQAVVANKRSSAQDYVQYGSRMQGGSNQK